MSCSNLEGVPGVGDNRPCDLATLLLSAVVQEREEISQQLARVAERKLCAQQEVAVCLNL